MSSHSTSVANDAATTTSHENTVTAIADKIGRNDLTADDQAEVDFWTAALEEHSNRAMLNISRQALAKLLGIVEKLRTEQRNEADALIAIAALLNFELEDATSENYAALIEHVLATCCDYKACDPEGAEHHWQGPLFVKPAANEACACGEEVWGYDPADDVDAPAVL